MKDSFKETVKGGIRRLAERYAPLDENRLTENIGLDLTDQPAQKRVLVAYLDWGKTGRMLRGAAPHTNYQECNQIVAAFLRRGYVVDVCLCNDDKDIKADTYDVIFGFGSAWRKACQCNPHARKILYSTENPAWISLEREQARCDYFARRHPGHQVGVERSLMCYLPQDYDLADAMVSLGETHYYGDFAGRPCLRLYPTGLVSPNWQFDLSHRKTTSFLVLGADGVVHKGYDLLLEVFTAHPDWELHYYGLNFTRNCKKLGLSIPKNVHDHGFLTVASDDFLTPAAQCGYVLLPSCSEGCPTSVLTGMLHGIVPAVMRGNGMDSLGELVTFFSGDRVEDVDSTLSVLAALPPAEYNARAEAVYRYARQNFVLPAFTAAFDRCLTQLSL